MPYVWFIFLCKGFGSLTAANLMDKVRGLQNLAYQLGLEEGQYNISNTWNTEQGQYLCVSKKDTTVHGSATFKC